MTRTVNPTGRINMVLFFSKVDIGSLLKFDCSG